MNAHLFGLCRFLLIYCNTPLSSVNAKTSEIRLCGPLSAGDTQTAYSIVVNIAAQVLMDTVLSRFLGFLMLTKRHLDYASVIHHLFQKMQNFAAFKKKMRMKCSVDCP